MMEKKYPPMKKRLKKVAVYFIHLTIFKTVKAFQLVHKLTSFIHGNYFQWETFTLIYF